MSRPPILLVSICCAVGRPTREAATAMIAVAVLRKTLQAGALPIVLGGDRAIPIPVLRAFDASGPITLIQIDQHIDWRS